MLNLKNNVSLCFFLRFSSAFVKSVNRYHIVGIPVAILAFSLFFILSTNIKILITIFKYMSDKRCISHLKGLLVEFEL